MFKVENSELGIKDAFTGFNLGPGPAEAITTAYLKAGEPERDREPAFNEDDCQDLVEARAGETECRQREPERRNLPRV